jgi:L-cysteine:1D-myo-inositol 2-amino-2-deoxy-alpha-D-glucopyranoside ligase
MKLYNTQTQTKEIFQPLRDNTVTMYVCGITPYDTTHLGHAFTYTAFDILYRVLQTQKYTINYTQNVTDIDDDILKRAKRDKRDWQELGQFWTQKYVNDMKTLNNIPPSHYSKATDTIPTIVRIIEKLIQNGYAYASQGNIYFDTNKDQEYGKLSHYSQETMITLSKERGADPDDPRKRNPLDFILWQQSLTGEPSWESPHIGEGPLPPGRPGWHIECSAIAYKYLDKNIDIHGGGNDLIYPHHESEIAQSEQYTGIKPFVRFWMHTGAVAYQGEKMSKSLGNLVMVSDLFKTYSPNAIRYLLLEHHYRQSWEYKHESMIKASQAVHHLEQELQKRTQSEKRITNDVADFLKAIEDDLDTPRALHIINETIRAGEITEAKKMWKILGFTLPRH